MFDGRLTLVCKRGPHLFCFDDLPVKRRVTLDARFNDEGYVFDVAAAAAEVGRCDLFLSLTPWCCSSLSELLGAWGDIPSVGFFEIYKHSLRLDYDKPSAELAFDVVRALRPDYRLGDFVEPVRYPDARREDVRQLLSILEPGTRTLTVHMDITYTLLCERNSLTPPITRRPMPLPKMRAAVSVVGCMPLLGEYGNGNNLYHRSTNFPFY